MSGMGGAGGGGAGSVGTGAPGQGSNQGSGSRSSGNNGGPNAGGSTSSSSSLDRAASQIEYMPNVLGCACHSVRPAGPPPPPNNAAVKPAGPKWKPGVVPGHVTWVPGIIPSSPVQVDGGNAPGGQQGDKDAGKTPWVPGKIPTGPGNHGPQNSKGPAYNPDADTHAEMGKIAAEANQALKDLYAKYPKFDADGKRVVPDPDDKERIARYENLTNSLKSPDKANQLAAAIAANKNDPLYNYLGGLRFASFLNQSKSNTDKSGAPDVGMTDIERIALYGYTTGDYTAINGALRKEKGNPSDPGLAAYAKYATDAMEKLPDYQAPAGKENKLYRAIFTEPYPGWGAATFVQGQKYSDYAFASTATEGVPGTWQLTIDGTKNAKDVGPYSAWPGEKEVLTMPGTEYFIQNVDRNKVTLVPL
ncbi:MAG: hypothetical protein HOW73_20065 [Polyangiaceae bacterium]|nr:hypothetical protein [Polyangiaceae bacterium]